MLIHYGQYGATDDSYSYSKVLDDSLASHEREIIRVNQSKSLLKHHRFDEALSKPNPLPDTPELPDEALLQKSLALYQLWRYQECWSTIVKCCQKHPKNTEAEILRSLVVNRLKEMDNGQYPFARMKAEAL